MTLLYCFDNFFKDPDAIREYALDLEYDIYEDAGIFPGSRTDSLHNNNKSFFQQSTDKVLTMINAESLEWSIKLNFQKILNYSDDKNSNLNKGWVHQDSSHMAGVIYLDPDPDPESGTSFYSLKEGEVWNAGIHCESLRNDFFNYKCSPDETVEYEKQLLANNSLFNKTSEIKNVYNRMIIFDASTYHAQTNCWHPEGMRFTMVMFMNCLTPVEDRPYIFKHIGYPAILA